MGRCEYDTGSMYGCRPACSDEATHAVTMRAYGGYPAHTLLVCGRHVKPTEGRMFPMHGGTVRLADSAAGAVS